MYHARIVPLVILFLLLSLHSLLANAAIPEKDSLSGNLILSKLDQLHNF